MKMLKIKQAAEESGLPPSLIRKLVLNGSVKALRSGSSIKNATIYISLESLHEYINTANLAVEAETTELQGIRKVN